MVDRVKLDVSGAQQACRGAGPATGERPDAEHEFGEVERLCEVVIGAEG
jgi:hypothetical protein